MADFVVDVSAGYGTVRIGDAEYKIRGLTKPVMDALAPKERDARRLQAADQNGDQVDADEVASVMIAMTDAQLEPVNGAKPAALALTGLWESGALSLDHHLRPMLEHLRGVAR